MQIITTILGSETVYRPYKGVNIEQYYDQSDGQ